MLLTVYGDYMARMKIGEILVAKGLVSPVTVERVVSRAVRMNKKIGTLFEENEIITSSELADALAEQFGYRTVGDIAQYAYPATLLEMVPEEMAMQHFVFPLKMSGNKLAVAIADPTDVKFIQNFAENNGLDLILYVTTRQSILSAISKHYRNRDIPVSNSVKVLIVDDSQNVLKTLSEILHKQGYRCLEANDGIEGFRMAMLEQPQVIITDKEMPKLGGYRLIESLKAIKETANIPAILITGAMNNTEEANAFAKGFFDYIKKPFDELSVVTRVKRALQFSARA
jgi:CheY-like chemotaxis protein